MVARGLLLTLRRGRSAYSVSDSLRAGMRAFAIFYWPRTESWRQAYLPWFRAVAHLLRMCIDVNVGHEQRGHFRSVCILHLLRLSGVG